MDALTPVKIDDNHHAEAKKANLKAEAFAAAKLMQDLANPHATSFRLPVELMSDAEGIAVSDMNKVGLIGSLSWGHGFVIARLNPHSEPRPRWSAPMFYKTKAAGVGMNLGFTEVWSVTLLSTRKAVEAFGSGHVDWGSDMKVHNFNVQTGTVKACRADNDVRQLSAQHEQDTGDAVQLSITQGALIDMSVTGWKSSADVKRNSILYGAHTHPAEILNGDVPPPEEFAEVYAELDRIIQRAAN